MKTTLFGQFLPNNNQIFYNLFYEGVDNCVTMASLLNKMVNAEDPGARSLSFNQITRLQEKANNIKHQVYAVSGKAFVSPFPRDDMYSLASAVYTVSDYINICSRRLNIYHIEIKAPIKEIAALIVDCCVIMADGVKALHDLSQTEVINEHFARIRQLEDDADKVYTNAISKLIAEETDTLEIIKYSDIFYALERATDKCERVVDVMESIVIKNA